jgi:putative toxin-antitoxin system antitoxin component (TIGR02293 family)
MASIVSPVDLLGGAKILGKKIKDPYGINERIRAGLPYAALEKMQKALSLSREETAAALSIPLRTLARRKRERHLSAPESDRLYRIARVFAHATKVFGQEEWAAEWFRAPHLVLGMETPLSRLDTDPGVTQVDEILFRIEYGVYS